MNQFPRITHAPDMMGGKACIRGMRVTVAMNVGRIAAGRTADDVLRDYPYLERTDIDEALRYALGWLRSETRRVAVKLVIDMNLLPRWAEFLRQAGYEPTHWSEIGAALAPDGEVKLEAAWRLPD